MKRTKLFIYILSFAATIILMLFIFNAEEIAVKKECNNEGSCPPQQKGNDDFFINPLNRFIVMI